MLGPAGGGAPARAWPGHDPVAQPPVIADRACARPACRAPATATLGFSYAEREVELVPLVRDRAPQTYDLCTVHAARTRPPHGWQLSDRRPDDGRRPETRRTVPADLGGDRTVAVLAAALRAVPGAVSEDAGPASAAEVAAEGATEVATEVAAEVAAEDAGPASAAEGACPPVHAASARHAPPHQGSV